MCTAVSLPALTKFYREHEGKRDQFEIIAFHGRGISSIEELERVLTPVIEHHWGGEMLPFPIILDAAGATAQQYQIAGTPTSLLIDPEGRVAGVEFPSEGALKERLAKELAR